MELSFRAGPALPSVGAMTSTVPAVDAVTFFAARLAHQTDVSDVHAAMAGGSPGFVLVDTRSAARVAPLQPGPQQ